jgi:hypothetical protein
MSSSALDRFCHRQNNDGTFDSICCSCFATIATTKDEHQLEAFEQRHDCVELARERLLGDKQEVVPASDGGHKGL